MAKKKVVEENEVVENGETLQEEIPVIEKTPEQAKSFVYITKARRGFVTVFDSNGRERFFDFNDNGVCGVCHLRNEAEAKLIETSSVFGSYFFRVEDESKIPSGGALKIVVGARSASNGVLPKTERTDDQLSKLIAESQANIMRTGRSI